MTDNVDIGKAKILIDYKSSYNEAVITIIKKTKSVIENSNIIKILKHNAYEKIVPFNLWFRNYLYKISNNFENNQNLRVRSYNSLMLTPLVSYDNQNLNQIKKFLSVMSLYQPFYPETFYAIWEFLQIKYINPHAKNFLHIGREERLGTIEAIIFFHEKFQHTYQYNIYHSWLSGKEVYDISNNTYSIMGPKINYLGQAYKIKFITSSNNLIKYDFISIDCIHLFQDIFQWDDEELDLQALLFYLLSSMNHLNENGSMLIRLNMIGSESWSIIFDIVFKVFKEYVFFRPSTINPFNSEIYLFLNKFEYTPWLNSVGVNFLKNLYRYEIYTTFHLNISENPENQISQKYSEEIQEWINTLNIILHNFSTPVAKKDLISKWHISNDLKQISDLSSTFDDKSVYFIFKVAVKEFIIKPILPHGLYKQPFYKKLIGKRAELNYYKRIMDTKPSQIFLNRRYNNRHSYLLTWEQLTNQIDCYHNLKFILKEQYNAEMVTNAWIKMYEMVNMFSNLIPSNKKVTTFHLCEAPGAFISSLNHYLSNRNQQLDWFGQTLKPKSTNKGSNAALEDHFGLISSYPNRWLFGDPNIDDSGDITHSDIIKFYKKHPLLQDIDFMTADAGLQCLPTELNEQEAYLGKINMGQIICILACLPVGKSAIFKTFLPMSEPLTISMMNLITHLFTSVSIVKPSTSHGSNSEVYIVVKEYKGIKEATLEQLYVLLDDPKITSKTLLFSQIEKPFFDAYMTNVSSLINRQIQSLTRNYYYYYHLEEIDKFKEISKTCIDDWLRINPIFVLKNKLLNE